MAIDSKTKTTTTNTDTADTTTTERPLARSLTRSYTTVFMHAEPGMDWHTRYLNMSPGASLALGGALGAVLSAAAVSPIVTVIDLSIVRASVDPSATGGLFGALRRTTADLWGGRLAWGRPLRLLFGVYGGTYLVANETMCFSALNGIDSKVPTAAAAAAFNVAAIAWKVSKIHGLKKKLPPTGLHWMDGAKRSPPSFPSTHTHTRTTASTGCSRRAGPRRCPSRATASWRCATG